MRHYKAQRQYMRHPTHQKLKHQKKKRKETHGGIAGAGFLKVKNTFAAQLNILNVNPITHILNVRAGISGSSILDTDALTYCALVDVRKESEKGEGGRQTSG